MEGYETTQEAATRLNLTDSRVRQLLLAGRFPGARRVGSRQRGQWLVPKGALPTTPKEIPEKTCETTETP